MTVSPLTLYLLWHPLAAPAQALAAAVYRWFHAASDDLLRSGMGLPVYFRSAPAPGGDGLPPDIDTAAAELNLVVVLAEARMVGDPAWARWLDALARQRDRVMVVPVALHDSAYRVPESLRRLNFLRIDERDDAAAGATVDAATQHARRSPRLLRQLTELIGRELALRLLPPARPDATGEACADERAPAPLTVFLSHSKRDGVAVAEALRSTIQDHNRVRAFVDDSDLPAGHAFASELERAAASDSAAMVAIVTDSYAARPWCRREVMLARSPRREPGHPHCWSVRPLLVVDQLDRAPTRSIAELGSATVVRWQPEQALQTVDLLMLEVLLGSYHRLRARQIPPAPGRQVIAWAPDPVTLLSLLRAAGIDDGDGDGDSGDGRAVDEVVYPGHALPQADRDALARWFPKLRLRSFAQAEAAFAAQPQAAAGRLVGLSIGFNPELGALGLGSEHFEELVLAVTRCIVEAGGRIAFGGMLRTSGMTETLLTLARSLVSDDDSADAPDPQARVLSYQRWPALPDVEQIARDVGVCEYVLVDSPLPAAQRLAHDARLSSPERSRQGAHALSAMRRAMASGGHRSSAGRPAPRLDARLVAGGLCTGFNGFLPGVLEEALYALEDRQPLFVLGGFGGGAALLARALLDTEAQPQMQPAFHRQASAAFRQLEQGLAAHGEQGLTEALFERLVHAIDRIRADPAAGLANGLDAAENHRLMRSDRLAEIIDMLRLGMSRLWTAAQ